MADRTAPTAEHAAGDKIDQKRRGIDQREDADHHRQRDAEGRGSEEQPMLPAPQINAHQPTQGRSE